MIKKGTFLWPVTIVSDKDIPKQNSVRELNSQNRINTRKP